VDQFIPEASPVIAKFGELVVEADPLFRLGGVPVASKVDNRFEPLVGLEIELDIALTFYSKHFRIPKLEPVIEPQAKLSFLRQNLGRRFYAVRERNQFN
jgi:hypothetical protein